MIKLDILVLPVHPDDAELGCAGTLLKHISAGKTVGIADLTRGDGHSPLKPHPSAAPLVAEKS